MFLVLALVVSLAFVFSGVVNPAADAPHSRPVYWLMENLRHRGIETRAREIKVPDLEDSALIRSGAGNYDAMCADCHLKPGITDSELHRGLYPQPPILSAMTEPTRPGHAFWIVKHGIKASGMPAWGKSMDDRSIWGMVAFLQRLPELTPEAYLDSVKNSAGHSHDSVETMDHEAMHHDEMNESEVSPNTAVAVPPPRSDTHQVEEHNHESHQHSEPGKH